MKVGLRPGRDVLRLEREWIISPKDSKKVLVVHNYGHGGRGFTLSWGSAIKVVHLLQDND